MSDKQIVKIDINSEEIIAKIEKATEAAKELKKALDDINNTDIVMSVINDDDERA